MGIGDASGVLFFRVVGVTYLPPPLTLFDQWLCRCLTRRTSPLVSVFIETGPDTRGYLNYFVLVVNSKEKRPPLINFPIVNKHSWTFGSCVSVISLLKFKHFCARIKFVAGKFGLSLNQFQALHHSVLANFKRSGCTSTHWKVEEVLVLSSQQITRKQNHKLNKNKTESGLKVIHTTQNDTDQKHFLSDE